MTAASVFRANSYSSLLQTSVAHALPVQELHASTMVVLEEAIGAMNQIASSSGDPQQVQIDLPPSDLADTAAFIQNYGCWNNTLAIMTKRKPNGISRQLEIYVEPLTSIYNIPTLTLSAIAVHYEDAIRPDPAATYLILTRKWYLSNAGNMIELLNIRMKKGEDAFLRGLDSQKDQSSIGVELGRDLTDGQSDFSFVGHDVRGLQKTACMEDAYAILQLAYRSIWPHFEDLIAPVANQH